MFSVGQLVICVGEAVPTLFGETLPVKGRVYTVRDVVFLDYETALRLCEIVNEPHDYEEGFFECAFFSTGFRPITDDRLQIFRSLLNPTPVDVLNETMREREDELNAAWQTWSA